MSENIPSDMYALRRFRPACIFTQSDKILTRRIVAIGANFRHVDNEDSDQIARMCRFI